MDKNTILGFVLIAAVLIGFTFLNKPSEEEIEKRNEQHRRDSIEHAQTMLNEQDKDSANFQEIKEKTSLVADDFFAAPVNAVDSAAMITDSANVNVEQKEEIITLENEKLKLEFSTKGARILSTQLKGYTTFKKDSLYLFKDQESAFYLQLRNKQGRALQTQSLIFTPVSKDDQSLVMRYSYSPTQYIDFIYTLSTDDYMVKFDINVQGMEHVLDRESAEMFELHWMQSQPRQEKSIKNEQRFSRISYKYVGGDVNELSESKNESKEASEPTKWIAFKDQFFSSILIADDQFKTILLDSRMLTSDEYLKTYEAKIYVPSKFDAAENSLKTGFRFYLGPLDFSHLKSYDSGVKETEKQLDLDKLVYLGWTLFRWVNQYFVIPVFNLLKSTGMSMGIIILLLTIIVKLIISPLTYKSFKSSAKMRVLKPQVDALNEKYPKQEQATEKQQATMALYNKAGVNPMAGCIPLLLQMPILIALFQFFPSAIDLRHQAFLWAEDLSTYDAIFEWSGNIPIVSWLFGNHISLFCLLMTVTNVVYTKFNMEMTNTGQQQMPGMKWMMYLMPLIFLFVLNDYPAGLTYYYFLSLLITIVLTLVFRYTIDEEKLLAQLEANKKKPKKKSGFMARLEEAQRMQQQQMRENNKKGKKK
jgi:YidC/Oxa1 family membrane protein insertase